MMPSVKSMWLRVGVVLTAMLALAYAAQGLAQDNPPQEDPPAKAPEAVAPAVAAQPNVGQAGQPPLPKDDEQESLFDLILKGGWVMIPLGLCSVIAVGLTIERFVGLRRGNIIPPDFLGELKQTLGTSGDTRAAMAYCEQQPSPVSVIIKAGIARMGRGQDAMEKAIEDAGEREVYKLKRSLRPLSVIATIAPLLGLLGTVYGLITAFQSAWKLGVGRGDALAKGIYEALVTTATGLTLAIPVLIVYQILSSKVDALVDDIDEHAIELLDYAADNELDHDADPS